MYKQPKEPYRNSELEIREWYDFSKKYPKSVLANTRLNEIVHGQYAINKQIGVPTLRKETFDADIFSDKPHETALRQLKSLNKRFGNVFTLEKGKTKGLWKIKLRYTKQNIADIMETPKGVKWINIEGKKYASLNYFKRHIKDTLKNKESSFRHKKDIETYKRILEYEKKYKNISQKEFQGREDLIRKYGKWSDTDRDRKKNWDDCFPFDVTRQDVVRRSPNVPRTANTPRSPVNNATQMQQKENVNLEEAEKIKKRIEAGEIQSYQDIPETYKSYFNQEEVQNYYKQKSEIEAYNNEVNEWKQAHKLVMNNKAYASMGVPSLQKKVREIMNDRSAYKEMKLKELGKEYNLKPMQLNEVGKQWDKGLPVQIKTNDGYQSLANPEVLVGGSKGEMSTWINPIKGYENKDINNRLTNIKYESNSKSGFDNSSYINNSRNDKGYSSTVHISDNYASDLGDNRNKEEKWQDWKDQVKKSFGTKEGLKETGYKTLTFIPEVSYETLQGWGIYGNKILKGAKLSSDKQDKYWETQKNKGYEQTAGITTGFLVGGVASPLVTSAVGTGVTLHQGARTLENPTPENIGAMINMGLPFAITKGKNVFVKVGSKEVPYNKVFGEFTSRNKEEIIKKFENAMEDGNYKGVHTTASNFKEFGKEGKRIEDKGVFMGEWGGGNPTWLNVGGEGKIKYSLNPLAELKNRPNVIKISFRNLEEIPKEIVDKGREIKNTKGRKEAYKFINEWYDKNAKVDTAYIPLRTEFKETPETQAIIPFKYDVGLKKNGNWIQKLKGYKEYVKVGNRNVPIKEFETYYTGKKYKAGELKDEFKSLAEEKYYPKEYKDVYKEYSSKSSGSSYNVPYASYWKYPYKKYNKEKYEYGKEIYGDSKYSYVKPEPYKYGYGYEPNYNYPSLPMINIYPKEEGEKMRRGKTDSIGKRVAYQPIIIGQDGEEKKGDPYETFDEAVNEGMIETDDDEEYKFTVKKGIVPEKKVKKGRNNAPQYKFKGRNGIYIEMKKYRRDKRKEKNSYEWLKQLNKRRSGY